jgi:hypothetical protein
MKAVHLEDIEHRLDYILAASCIPEAIVEER